MLICFRGGFWLFRVETRSPATADAAVAVVVPARDEAGVIGDAVIPLVTQNYAGRLHIFVVDDHSTDGTADRARTAAARAGGSDRLTVIEAADLPAGWTGKLWAVSQGLDAARAISPDYVLLTDADIEHGPDSVAELVARAEDGRLRPGVADGGTALRIDGGEGADPGFRLLLFQALSTEVGEPAARSYGCRGGRLHAGPRRGARADRGHRIDPRGADRRLCAGGSHQAKRRLDPAGIDARREKPAPLRYVAVGMAHDLEVGLHAIGIFELAACGDGGRNVRDIRSLRRCSRLREAGRRGGWASRPGCS